MTKIDEYRQTLSNLTGWDQFLLASSGLPGPRANLELARAVADLGDEAHFQRYVARDPQQAPTNSPSVALIALPETGKPLFEQWLESDDPDVRWLIRENLRKKRLQKLDASWVSAVQYRIDGGR